jgi:hypothetical protein
MRKRAQEQDVTERLVRHRSAVYALLEDVTLRLNEPDQMTNLALRRLAGRARRLLMQVDGQTLMPLDGDGPQPQNHGQPCPVTVCRTCGSAVD